MKHLLTIVALLFVAAGCDSEMGNGQDVPDGGAPTLGPGRGSDAGVAKSDTMTSRPTSNNPCLTQTPGCYVGCSGAACNPTILCGWDPTTNTCFTTVWCGPSVASVGLNKTSQYATTLIQIQERPLGSVCTPGITTYTFKTGTLYLWGSNVTNSAYSSGSFSSDGFICVLNSQDYTINC